MFDLPKKTASSKFMFSFGASFCTFHHFSMGHPLLSYSPSHFISNMFVLLQEATTVSAPQFPLSPGKITHRSWTVLYCYLSAKFLPNTSAVRSRCLCNYRIMNILYNSGNKSTSIHSCNISWVSVTIFKWSYKGNYSASLGSLYISVSTSCCVSSVLFWSLQ